MIEFFGMTKLMDNNVILQFGADMDEPIIEIEIADFGTRPPAGTLVANGHPLIRYDMATFDIVSTKMNQPFVDETTSGFFMGNIITTGHKDTILYRNRIEKGLEKEGKKRKDIN
jgi:hypothetical protein